MTKEDTAFRKLRPLFIKVISAHTPINADTYGSTEPAFAGRVLRQICTNITYNCANCLIAFLKQLKEQ